MWDHFGNYGDFEYVYQCAYCVCISRGFYIHNYTQLFQDFYWYTLRIGFQPINFIQPQMAMGIRNVYFVCRKLQG